MSASPSDSDPLPDDFDDLDGLEGTDPSGEAASDPEEARREAEDALSEIEALADLDDDPDVGGGPSSDEGTTPGEDATAGGQTATEDPTETASDEGAPEDQCENCGALLHGPYCSQCGQKSAERILPVWHMVNEALEAVFELDLRVFRTFPKFVFLPGRLTKEYLNGRRKRYIRPFRLYLFSTFLLFAVIALTTTGNFGLVLDPQGMARLNPPNTAIRASRSPDTTATTDDTSSFFGDPEQRKKAAEELRSDSTSIDIDLYDDPAANARLERTLRMKLAQALEDPWEAVNGMIDRGPYVMFFMLPIFAFLLKLLYIRRGRLYMEHMIFSLHVHAFAFFAFTVALLLNESDIGWLNTMATWVELSPLLYFVLALSHVYEQGLIKSSIKAFILFLIYGVVLSIGFAVLLLLAVLFI